MLAAEFPELTDTEAAGEESKERTRRLLAFVLLLAVVVLLVLWFLSRLATVPDVIGMSEQDARRTLLEAGFEAGEITTIAATQERPVGLVADQTPDEGNLALKGSDIALAIATGPAVAEPVAGRNGVSPGLGLDIPLSSRESTAVDYVPHDVTPPLTGPRVPFVLNMTESEARSILSSAGYGVRVDYGPSTAGVREGRVYFQDPAPDTWEDRGTSVTIWISTGVPQGGAPYDQPD